MREETVKIYQFAELSEQAKERAREWYWECIDANDYECVIEDAVRMGEMLGIEFDTRPVKLHGGGVRHEPCIYWSGFSSQGDGASFTGRYRYRKGALKAIKAEAPAQWTSATGEVHESKDNAELHRIARELQQAQARQFYGLSTRIEQSGRYVHEMTMQFEHAFSNPRTGYTEDYYESDATAEITEALRDFARWIYCQLDEQNDYLNSDEYADEGIGANEYEFYENGERA